MQPYCVLFTNQLSQTKYHKFISLWALPMKCLPMKIIILKAKDSRLKREKKIPDHQLRKAICLGKEDLDAVGTLHANCND